MPTVASLEALERAAADFEIGETRLVIEPAALTEARRSLDSSGLLLTARAARPGQAGRTPASRR